MTLGRRITTVFGGAVLILVAVALVSAWTLRRMAETTHWVAHTHVVIERVDDLLVAIIEAESHKRSYLLLESPEFLTLHEQDFARTRLALKIVQELTSDNPLQQSRLRELTPRIEDRLETMQLTLEARKNEGLKAALQVMTDRHAESAMADIRSRIAQIVEGEHGLLTAREKAARRSSEAAVAVLAAGLALAILLTVAGGIFLTRSITLPVRKLADALEAFRAGRWERPLAPPRASELAQLVRAFNEMAEARRRSEIEMAEANALLDGIVENVPSMLFMKDAKDLAFVRINRAGEELLGVKRDQLLGKTDHDFFPPDQARFFQEKDRRTLQENQVLDIPEEPIETARGRRWLHTRKVAIHDNAGRPRFLLGVSRDITEHKEAGDKLLHAKEAAEAANRELEAFSYSVSHDLRAPLRAIDGFSQALLEDLGPTLDPQSRDHLDRVRAATQRMGKLIDDLIALSRVSRAELRRERVDLTALAREILESLRGTQPDRQVEVVVADGLLADADPSLTRILLENLLGNAWKFTARKPQARIEVGRAVEPRGPNAFYVRDNGAGFDMVRAQKLFGAFQRLHTAREFEGTGIGLATVQRIIHRHGGKIWAMAREGEGASFHFTVQPLQN